MHALLLAAVVAWGSLTPGPHKAGFRVLDGESAPGAAGSQPRPIEVAVWYPASGGGEAVAFGDYFRLAADLRRRSGDTLSGAITGDPGALTPEQAAAVLTSPMFARRDARAAAGPFPVVMWSARYGTVAAQAVLSEYLASHGYVVAAVWPKEAQEKLPFELNTAAGKLDELDAQSDDVRGALRLVRALDAADDARTALLSWSYAGESAWRIAQTDARVELVVSLDSNVRTGWVYQSAASIEAAPFQPRYVSLDKETFEVRGLAHGNFNALEGMIPAVFGIERVQRWSKAGSIARTGYEALSRRVAAELRRTFESAPPAMPERFELRAADGNLATAELHRPLKSGGRCAALFHQSGSSRGEYRTIARELTRMGWTALAIDVRWGNADRWNDVVNETAARHGTPAAWETKDRVRIDTIRAGAPHDLDAAVDWLRANGCSEPVVVWGASIHANGVLELALRRPDDIAAVVAVSPGEYAQQEPDRMKTVAARVNVPALVLWGRGEDEVSKPVFEALRPELRRSYVSSGRHGNPVFFEDPGAWAALKAFLAKAAPAASR